MKTLDEVIKANECCDHGESDSRCEDCPYNGIGACCAERESDALQWLKGYRAHIELDKLRDKCETKNDPLSWDELRSMEGKPVYVKLLGAYESYPNASRWMLVQSDVSFGNAWFIDRSGARYCFYEKDMNEIWQAYRRERS